MPEQTIDPIFAPSALNGILSKMRDDDTFGSLREQMQLQGKVNEGAQTAVIILAGGSGDDSVTKAASSSLRSQASLFSRAQQKCSTVWAMWGLSWSFAPKSARANTS